MKIKAKVNGINNTKITLVIVGQVLTTGVCSNPKYSNTNKDNSSYSTTYGFVSLMCISIIRFMHSAKQLYKNGQMKQTQSRSIC